MTAVRYSATRAQLADLCLLKWWRKEVQGDQQDTSYGLEFGQAVHNTIEARLKGEDLVVNCSRLAGLWREQMDRKVTAGRVKNPVYYSDAEIRAQVQTNSQAMVAAIERLGDIVGTEIEFDLGWCVGAIDCLIVQNPKGEVWLVDFKNYADPTKYGVTSKTMLKDFQVALYGHAVMTHVHPCERINISWIKGWNRPGRRRKPLEIETLYGVTLADLEPTVNKIKRTFDRMKLAVAMDTPPPSEYDENPFTRACDAYGGCPYKSDCRGINDMPAIKIKSKKLDDTIAKKDLTEGYRANRAVDPATVVPPKGGTAIVRPLPVHPQEPPPSGNRTLYIGCIPHGRSVTEVAALVREAFVVGDQDYRMIEYGKGVPVMQALAQQCLDGWDQDLYMPATAWYRAHLEPALIAWADTVIQAVV